MTFLSGKMPYMKNGGHEMKYGYFDDINREYVITDPATPLPWINYLGCQRFFHVSFPTPAAATASTETRSCFV